MNASEQGKRDREAQEKIGHQPMHYQYRIKDGVLLAEAESCEVCSATPAKGRDGSGWSALCDACESRRCACGDYVLPTDTMVERCATGFAGSEDVHKRNVCLLAFHAATGAFDVKVTR